MANQLQKVNAGDPLEIPAGTFNVMIDAARDFLARRAGKTSGTAGAGESGLALVRNDSGADRDQFDILGIDGVVFDTVMADQHGTQALKGVTPTVAGHTGRFAVLLEPANDGEVAQACLAGLCVARITLTVADDEYADVTNGDATRLTSGPEGSACILWKSISAPGQGWAVVRLGNPSGRSEVLFGKPTAQFTSGATIELDPCDVHGTDNGQPNVTVYVLAGQGSYSLTNSTSIGTDQIVPYTLGDDDNYYVLGTPVEVVTNYQIDGNNLKFQKKTRNVWVLTTGTESDWVDVHTGDDCPTP